MQKNNLASQLASLRTHYNASFEEISQRTAISVERLTMFEAGTKTPSAVELAILAKLFRVSYEFFVFSTPQAASSGAAKTIDANKRLRFVRLFTLASILLLGGAFCIVYFLEFGSFSFNVTSFGQDYSVTYPLKGIELLKHFLNADFFVRLLVVKLYAVLAIGGGLILLQLVRMVLKNQALKTLTRRVAYFFVGCFLVAVMCYIKLFSISGYGFILYLLALFASIVCLFFSFIKEVNV